MTILWQILPGTNPSLTTAFPSGWSVLTSITDSAQPTPGVESVLFLILVTKICLLSGDMATNPGPTPWTGDPDTGWSVSASKTVSDASIQKT